jgi:hypothetical protein
MGAVSQLLRWWLIVYVENLVMCRWGMRRWMGRVLDAKGRGLWQE